MLIWMSIVVEVCYSILIVGVIVKEVVYICFFVDYDLMVMLLRWVSWIEECGRMILGDMVVLVWL